VALFFRRLRCLPFIPEAFRLQFAEDFLAKGVPPVNSAHEAALLNTFVAYYRDYWLRNRSVSKLWGHFGDERHRTTNGVEGYHNGLHTRFSTRHPSLGELLEFLQTEQHTRRCRMFALENDPRTVPAQPNSTTVKREQELAFEMRRFYDHYVGLPSVWYELLLQYLDNICSVFH
jgi:hypothetical protein